MNFINLIWLNWKSLNFFVCLVLLRQSHFPTPLQHPNVIWPAASHRVTQGDHTKPELLTYNNTLAKQNGFGYVSTYLAFILSTNENIHSNGPHKSHVATCHVSCPCAARFKGVVKFRKCFDCQQCTKSISEHSLVSLLTIVQSVCWNLGVKVISLYCLDKHLSSREFYRVDLALDVFLKCSIPD